MKVRNNPDQISGLKQMVFVLTSKAAPNTQVVAEIGSFAGESTKIIAGYVAKIFAADPWRPNYDPNDPSSEEKNLAQAELDFDIVCKYARNIIKLKMTSLEASRLFENKSLDWVYIDGDHRYRPVTLDIRAWLPKCKLAICGHDYAISSVKSAVDNCLGKPDLTFKDTSWIKFL